MEINKAVEEFKKILNKKIDELESETKIESEKKMESGTIKLCPSPIQLDGLAFYKAPYKYYVKGTTLRLLCNMSREDLHAKNNNGWVGCDARNKAKRLIARNRRKLKEKENGTVKD